MKSVKSIFDPPAESRKECQKELKTERLQVTPFGRLLRKYRKERELILKDLADAMQVTSATISAMEFGKQSVGVGFVRRCVRFFGLDSIEAVELSFAATESNEKYRNIKV